MFEPSDSGASADWRNNRRRSATGNINRNVTHFFLLDRFFKQDVLQLVQGDRFGHEYTDAMDDSVVDVAMFFAFGKSPLDELKVWKKDP